MRPMVTQLHHNRVVRMTYLALGFVCLGLGFIGIFLPLMPTTVFMLLAAFFFARSSERWHTWMLEHPRFGRVIRDYQAGLGIPVGAKVLAVSAVIVAFALSIGFAVDTVVWRVALGGLGLAIIAFILTRPTRARVSQEVSEKPFG